MLRVGLSPGKGRGVFATHAIDKGTLLERAPVLVIPAAEWPDIEKTVLFHYTFAFGEDDRDYALALGLGALINHSFTPNALYIKRTDGPFLDFIALRAIAEGEEITVNYNGAADDRTPLW